MFFPTGAKKVLQKYGILYNKREQTSTRQAPQNETLGNPVQKFRSILVGNPTICLHGIEIGSIDFSVSVTDCHRFPYIADALHFPNRPWLRSFHLPWGLSEKKGKNTVILPVESGTHFSAAQSPREAALR